LSPFLSITCLIAPVLISGVTAMLVKINQINLRLLLAFSAAYLFSLSIIHLLPEAFLMGSDKQVGLFIVLGFCLQLLIDTFSTGIEHGHVHQHNKDCKTQLPYGILVGLMLHAFLEGLPIYNPAAASSAPIDQQLILGLALHNIPITIAFVSLLKEHQSFASRNWMLLILFSVMSPIGYLSSFVLQKYGLSHYETFGRMAFALVIGIFLHISTAILFESSEQHKYNRAKWLIMVSGIVLAYLIS
jgi:zinc and cadmium transporter